MGRVRLTVSQKIAICDCKRASPTLTNLQIGQWAATKFNVKCLAKSTVSEILAAEQELRQRPAKHANLKKRPDPCIDLLDTHLAKWVDDMSAQKLPITGRIIVLMGQVMAISLAIPTSKQPCYSEGWLHHFKKRHGFAFRRLHGEAGSVDSQEVEGGRKLMQAAASGYWRCDVFNMDETGFYRQVPMRTIARGLASGLKQDKSRVTLCVGSNADGTKKLPLLVIGTAKNPVAFRGHDVEGELGIGYVNTKKGWMTGAVFRDWLEKLNADMKTQTRHILLFIDNVSSHNETGLELSNIKLVRLPPNKTSVLQPMD